MPKSLIIAIDGPVAAGKSAVGTELASRLEYKFVDTGVMYRALTWAVLRDKVDPNDEIAVTELSKRTEIQIDNGINPKDPQIIVDGENITSNLRTADVEKGVPLISRYDGVRQSMVSRQRQLASTGMLIMAGRDIGTVVLPDADLKIFLTASPEERARRRHIDIEDSGQATDYSKVLDGLIQRDKIDTERHNSPLKPASGAHILTTDGITLTEVVDFILALAETG